MCWHDTFPLTVAYDSTVRFISECSLREPMWLHSFVRLYCTKCWCTFVCHLSTHKAVDWWSMYKLRTHLFNLFGNLKHRSSEASCIRYINIEDLRTCLWKTSTLLPLTGGGHLHGEDGRPVLYLSILPADPEKRLHPRVGHLFSHRVHQVSQEDWLLHWSVASLVAVLLKMAWFCLFPSFFYF